jgi:hypothetical protein
MRMSQDEAIAELLKKSKIEGRIRAVQAVRDSVLLDIG